MQAVTEMDWSAPPRKETQGPLDPGPAAAQITQPRSDCSHVSYTVEVNPAIPQGSGRWNTKLEVATKPKQGEPYGLVRGHLVVMDLLYSHCGRTWHTSDRSRTRSSRCWVCRFDIWRDSRTGIIQIPAGKHVRKSHTIQTPPGAHFYVHAAYLCKSGISLPRKV